MKTKSVIFFLVFVFCAFTISAQVNVQDSLALVALYDSTNGPNWNHSDNWLTGPVPTWYGITVTGDRVTKINLGDILVGPNNLKGNIPPEIGDLTNLQSLRLGYNQITGLPPEISNLTSLQHLSLEVNQITSVPPEIGNLTNLQYLSFDENQITSFPPEIGNLTSLQQLGFIRNQLTSVPSEIGNLINLQGLDLGINQLTSVPSEIGNLINLQGLGLGGNQLTSLPSEIGNLVNLDILSVSDCQLISLPSEIGNLTRLRSLRLDFNSITALPAEIGNLTNLQVLNLDNNQITNLPSEFVSLASLISVNLNNNQITVLPTELTHLINLQSLYLNGNQITALPPEIGNLTNLQYLYLEVNNLISLPPEVGNLTNLTWLYLNNNQITALPPEIGNLISLQGLYLNNNQLTSLPAELANLSPNCYLSLSYNNLTFEDLEWVVQTFTNRLDYPQANIPVYKKNDILFVSAGGTLSNNTYHWIMVDEAGETTIVGDSVFHPSQSGQYYALVTNSICTDLTLYTDTIFYNATLPVAIIDLNAQQQKSIVQVAWTSVTETNVAGYEIQHSSNALNFSTIGTLSAKGNGVQKVNYTFSDMQPLPGNNYYRIKALDNDGKVTYSNTVLVDIGENKTIALVYPNPAKDVLHIRMDNGGAFVLTDQAGKILLTKTIHGNEVINVTAMPSGLYFLKNIETGDVQKIIINR